MSRLNDLDGFDPLEASAEAPASDHRSVFEEASKRIVHNILKCYTGSYDVFSELLQNSLDAVESRKRQSCNGYQPQIWITIDIPAGKIRVVDNGVGMDSTQFRYCLRPSVSFKRQAELRGHKGVGATFLAYGFSFIKLQTKFGGIGSAVVLRQGRQWAEDTSGTIPRPTFQAVDFEVPELEGASSGTAIEIIVGKSAGERPKDLGWLGAHSAEQWFDVLRIKTPMGGIYLRTPPFKPRITLSVKSPQGVVSSVTRDNAEYYYPHEIPGLRTKSLTEIRRAIEAIQGDAAMVASRLDSQYKRLDCMYEIWGRDGILDQDSPFLNALSDDDRRLVERHDVIVYACFLRSARLWGEFNDDTLKLRKGQNLLKGGLQIASDFMPQGDLTIIPLTSTIGYQANSHVIVHFTDGDPDMGRKTFQPELKALAESLSVRAVNKMKAFLSHVRPDSGAPILTNEKELHEWKKAQEQYRERFPLSYQGLGGRLGLVSIPQQEQDVIALFHELIGMGVLQGYRFFATSQHDRYDSLFFMDYEKGTNVHFDRRNARLGIAPSIQLPHSTEPKVLEYKFCFDGLISDLDREEKFVRQINLVVCWTVGTTYKERFYFQSLLVGEDGSDRQFHGSTHKVYPSDSREVAFEVLVLEDLLRWLQAPEDEEARQKVAYRD